jgi:hypothetical protein
MKPFILGAALLCFLTTFGQTASAQGLEFAFEAHSLQALDFPEQSVAGMREALAAVFPVGRNRTYVDETLEHLRKQTRSREQDRGDPVGDDTNIRDCRQATPDVLTCVWFLFIPPSERQEAMAQGIYGMTWILRFQFSGNDVLEALDVELLIEHL